jgi:putative transposase
MDEVFVKINGELHHLWRPIDHEGEALECYVSKRGSKDEALKFLKNAMRKHGRRSKEKIVVKFVYNTI